MFDQEEFLKLLHGDIEFDASECGNSRFIITFDATDEEEMLYTFTIDVPNSRFHLYLDGMFSMWRNFTSEEDLARQITHIIYSEPRVLNYPFLSKNADQTKTLASRFGSDLSCILPAEN
jgi:hypothetical protein